MLLRTGRRVVPLRIRCTSFRRAMSYTIRTAQPEDVKAIHAIYVPYVTKTPISLEIEPPSLEEMKARFEKITARFPYIVAESDGKILGYAYSSTFRDRAGYNHTIEDSIYCADEARGKGLGSALLKEILERSRKAGFEQCIGAMTDCEETKASIALHVKFGFKQCARFVGVGRKFGKTFDVVAYQLPLQTSSATATAAGNDGASKADAASASEPSTDKSTGKKDA